VTAQDKKQRKNTYVGPRKGVPPTIDQKVTEQAILTKRNEHVLALCPKPGIPVI